MTTQKSKGMLLTAAATTMLASTMLATLIETPQTLGGIEAEAASSKFKAASTAKKALRFKVTKATTIRKSTNTTSANVASLAKGKFVKITGTQGSYTKVKYGNKVGFVPTSTISVRKATNVKTVSLTGKITKAGTLRDTYGTDWSTSKVTTVAKNEKVTIKKYVTFDKIKYAQVKAGSKTGYIVASSVSAVDPYPTKTPSGLNVTRDLSDKNAYLYETHRLKPIVTNPSDVENTVSILANPIIHVIGSVTVNDIKYKQIVTNDIVNYVKVSDFEEQTKKLTTSNINTVDYPSDLYLDYIMDMPLTPTTTALGNTSTHGVKKGTNIKIIGRIETPGLTLAYKVKYTIDSKSYVGFVPSNTQSRKVTDNTLIDDDSSYVNDDDSITPQGSFDDVDETVTKPSKDDATSVSVSNNETYVGDTRRRFVVNGAKIYKDVPTSTTSPSYSASMYSLKQVLKISSVKTTKIGDVVKVAFSRDNSGKLKTGYIPTKYLKDGGNVTLATSYGSSLSPVIDVATGEYLRDTRYGTKESYIALAEAMQNTFYIPLIATTDNVLLPGTSLSAYSRFTDEVDIRDTAWSDINKKTIKLDGIYNGSKATPTTTNEILATYKKTKTYIFDTQDLFEAKYKTDIHKSLATLIEKYDLANNSIVYVSDGVQTAAEAAAEIHAISPETIVIQLLSEKQQKSFKASNYNTKDLHGFAFNANRITDSIIADLKKNNLSLNVHRDTDRNDYTDFTTKSVKYTKGVFSGTGVGLPHEIGVELNAQF